MGIAVMVDWFGPYATKRELAKSMSGYADGTKCLYMAVREDGTIHYLGRTERAGSRMREHEKMALARECGFYCGHIVSQGIGGRRARKCKTDLGTAERALIVALQPEANEHLKAAAIEDCVVIYSRFWDAESEERRVSPPAPFPSMLAYESWTGTWDAGLPTGRAC